MDVEVSVGSRSGVTRFYPISRDIFSHLFPFMSYLGRKIEIIYPY